MHSAIQVAGESGAKVLTGGDRDGAVITPAVVAAVDPQSPFSRDELFDPPSRYPAPDMTTAIAIANDNEYGLGAGIFTSDVAATAVRAMRQIDAGNIHINWTPLWRADLMPYGGLKGSGIGKEGVRPPSPK